MKKFKLLMPDHMAIRRNKNVGNYVILTETDEEYLALEIQIVLMVNHAEVRRYETICMR